MAYNIIFQIYKEIIKLADTVYITDFDDQLKKLVILDVILNNNVNQSF